MNEQHPTEEASGSASHAFDAELPPEEAAREHLAIDDMAEVKLAVSADLGHCPMTVREVMELQRGSVLALNKVAGDLVDIHINGVPFGKGEIVVLVDALHVRLAEVHGAEKEGSHA